jgi:hypothetical protein
LGYYEEPIFTSVEASKAHDDDNDEDVVNVYMIDCACMYDTYIEDSERWLPDEFVAACGKCVFGPLRRANNHILDILHSTAAVKTSIVQGALGGRFQAIGARRFGIVLTENGVRERKGARQTGALEL